jgi:hypothetical protein
MRRLLAGAALAFTSAFVPFCARAEAIEPVAPVYAVPAGLTFPRFEHSAQRRRSLPLRAVVYAFQAYDAAQTAAALRHEHRREQNAMVRPFSHGGFATLALGFALGDVARERILRRAPEAVRDGADAAQAFTNLDGILNTRRTMRAP